MLLASAAIAGPIGDFESEFGKAYADYRAALFQTNKKDKAATEQAMAGFADKWTAIKGRYGANPPPHYAEAPGWSDTLARIDKVVAEANAEVAKGELAKAHEVLEALRDTVSELRARNGVVSFSDRMNAYHEVMEQVLGKGYDGFSAAGLAMLREDAAVLAHLVAQIEQHPPRGLAEDKAYLEAFGALKASVSGLLSAARSGDAAVAKQAREALKPPYSRMFLKFG